jgi:hypothetical protein
MRNCYFHILLSYAQPRFFISAAAFLFGLFLLAKVDGVTTGYYVPVLFTYSPVGLIVAYLKYQIASPSASIIPRYRLPHLIIAALLLLPILLLPPLVASWPHANPSSPKRVVLTPPVLSPATAGAPAHSITSGNVTILDALPTPARPYFPLFSLGFASAAWLAWAVYKNQNMMMVTAIAAALLTELSAIHTFLLHLVAAPFSVEAAVLSVGALIAFIALARNLFHLTEESRDYHRPNPFAYVGKLTRFQMNAPGSAINYHSRIQQLLYAPNDRIICGLRFDPHVSLRHRIARWSAVSNGSRGMWIIGLLIAIPSLAGSLFELHNAALALPLLWVFPGPLIIGIAWRHRVHFGYKSLYPLSRSTFLIEQGLVSASQWAQIWIPMALVTLVLNVAFTGPATLPALLMNIALAGANQLLIFAITLWLMRFSSFPLLLLPVTLASMFWPMTLIFSKSITASPYMGLLITALLFVSAAVLYDAYRRWMITDLA